jgi:hypothetical protein
MNTSGQRYFPADRDLEAIAERDLWASVFLQAIDDLTETKGPKPRAIQEGRIVGLSPEAQSRARSYGYAVILISTRAPF